jgi:DNA invertase Pin-like site-specific DNA recombinase
MKLLDTYDVGIYCRLSRDDGKKGKQESLSIENQKRILTEYVNKRKEDGWNLKEVYTDDGKSGMNFDRDGFNKMVRDLKSKRINCVVVKSIDRLGRGTQTEAVMDELFIIPQVRFIAISEGVDTLEGVDYLIDIIHSVNGIYPKQVSRKVRQVKRDCAEQGFFMNSVAPYGYAKSPQDKHKLIIDEPAAENVRRMFFEFASGDSARMIADRLNDEGVDSPQAYHNRKEGKENPLSGRTSWGSESILRLLRNQVYIGHMVQGKREVASIKTKQRRQIDPADWIVVENTHEAVVDYELWNRVQSALECKRQARKTKRTGDTDKHTGGVGLFAGLLKCSECGATLSHMTRPLKNRTKSVYRCSRYNNNGGKTCSPHNVDEADLCEYVMNDLREYGILSEAERRNLSKRLIAYTRQTQGVEAKSIRAQIQHDEHRLTVIASCRKSLYEDKTEGIITVDEFKELNRGYASEKAEIEERLPRLRRELDRLQETTAEVDRWLDLVESCVDVETLDRDTVTGLIDRIEVSERTRQGEKEQEISIYYRFIGALPENTKEDAAS